MSSCPATASLAHDSYLVVTVELPGRPAQIRFMN